MSTLPSVVFAINTSKHHSTKLTQFFLMHNWNPSVMVDDIANDENVDFDYTTVGNIEKRLEARVQRSKCVSESCSLRHRKYQICLETARERLR